MRIAFKFRVFILDIPLQHDPFRFGRRSYDVGAHLHSFVCAHPEVVVDSEKLNLFLFTFVLMDNLQNHLSSSRKIQLFTIVAVSMFHNSRL